MKELVVERECHDVVCRLSIGGGRNRRKAQAWSSADYYRVGEIETGPTRICERYVRDSLGERRRCQTRRNVPGGRRGCRCPRWRGWGANALGIRAPNQWKRDDCRQYPS